MKVLELFAGTGSVSRAFRRHGHETFTVDWEPSFKCDLCADVMQVDAARILRLFGRPDVIWASPDCTTYSVAAIYKHRRRESSGNLTPVTEKASKSDRVNVHLHNLIMTLSPNLWFIENPRSAMRKMDFMSGLPRYTVTYCQYGDTRMKPTDIWTNHPDPQFRPPCKNGDPCHEAAPRGSSRGTQGIKEVWQRSMIPDELCEHIVRISERYVEGGVDGEGSEPVWHGQGVLHL